MDADGSNIERGIAFTIPQLSCQPVYVAIPGTNMTIFKFLQRS